MSNLKKALYSTMLILIFPFGIILITGSAQNQYTPTYTPSYASSPSIYHNYIVDVRDLDGNPIKDAKIDYTSKDRNIEDNPSIEYTAYDGKILVMVKATVDPRFPHLSDYKTEFNYSVEKEGYYPIKNSMSSTSDTYSSEINEITLIKPIDYFDKVFITSEEGANIKVEIQDVIDLIKLQSILSEALLKTRSISLIEFKKQKYLSFGFNSVNVYNSLKLDKYDIGKRLFDNVVRKILNPIDKYISDSRIFYGYNILVIGHTKSFTDENATSKNIEYNFYISKELVRNYKNKDISGQKLLDNSIILMDDERIELKLQ